MLNPVIQDPLFQPADGLLVYDVSRECVVVKSINMTPKHIEFCLQEKYDIINKS